MAHVIDVRNIAHEELQEEDVDEVQMDASTQDQNGNEEEITTQARPNLSRARSLATTLRTSKRAKVVSTIVAVLTVVAVSLGVALNHGAKATTTQPTSSKTIPVTPQTDDPIPFLALSFQGGGDTASFVLGKAHWNESFMVYPTVVKHSSPQRAGKERGSALLDTSNYVFHFEKSPDGRSLLLVCENHLTRLQSEDDELKQVYEDSQWPGYYTRIPIYMETDDAYYFPTDPLLAHGFFVSISLMTPYYTAIRDGSAFFPRNSNLQFEYELDDGVVWVNYAVGLLPETPMSQRVADDRVGYFMQRYVRLGVDNNDPANATDDERQYMDTSVTVINRQRLELDPKSGKTVQPIVYYIDPSVPTRWRDAFALGVTAWAPAFEAIGFKDAIKAVQPGDADWPEDYRLGDLRYNSISVMVSDRTYAHGPFVFDPRSGEILHSDITFEYGFFDEVVADFNLRSPVEPFSTSGFSRNDSTSHGKSPHQCGIGKNPQHKLDRATVGMLLGTKMSVVPDHVISRHFTDIVMHEVGHTLGLRHNFAGSALVSRANLADPSFTSTKGVSASIMDYISVNIFSDLTTSAIKTHDFYQTVIGSYDMAAIAYGYSVIQGETYGFKHKQLSKLAQAAPLFLTDEDADMWTNPYAQRFDISSDPIDYANDRLELVKIFRNASLANKVVEDASWANLWRYERTMLSLINDSIAIIQPFLGAMNATHAHRKPGEMSFSVPAITRKTQERALGVLARIIRADEGLFPTPAEYSSYIKVVGYDLEDCDGPSNDFGCLARGVVDIDAKIRSVRVNAVTAALFPALDRIIALDVNSPLSITDVLKAVEAAAYTKIDEPRNEVVYTYYRSLLRQLLRDTNEDIRLRTDVYTFLQATVTHEER